MEIAKQTKRHIWIVVLTGILLLSAILFYARVDGSCSKDALFALRGEQLFSVLDDITSLPHRTQSHGEKVHIMDADDTAKRLMMYHWYTSELTRLIENASPLLEVEITESLRQGLDGLAIGHTITDAVLNDAFTACEQLEQDLLQNVSDALRSIHWRD